ncbi:MAG TPA: hypothetical protein DEA90_12865 [Opitutae bacterium]|nr:hypothetical protein [Puniceicoccaceae bacterium]HBR95044.1 hypothetical protein [Opitutae bacterium]|tara:strand:- start:588 stop:1442 length:855 start_codon:yes stop_codon:yes gene_type:complete
MKISMPIVRQSTSHLFWLMMAPLLTFAQSESRHPQAPAGADTRPAQTDSASAQLIKNYLTVTGALKAQPPLLNVVAQGRIKESTLERQFHLIETSDGKRRLTYSWTHLGRKHRVLYVHDGLQTWIQVLEPKQQTAHSYTGVDAQHFANQRWLLQPFTLPKRADYKFKYQGTALVAGRPAYMIKGYGKANIHSWFYFDQEKSLLTRWGGQGKIAGVTEAMDYQASQFKPVDGILIPSYIQLLAQNAPFGYIQVEQMTINQDLNEVSFFMPEHISPTLRQRPTVKN